MTRIGRIYKKFYASTAEQRLQWCLIKEYINARLFNARVYSADPNVMKCMQSSIKPVLLCSGRLQYDLLLGTHADGCLMGYFAELIPTWVCDFKHVGSSHNEQYRIEVWK